MSIQLPKKGVHLAVHTDSGADKTTDAETVKAALQSLEEAAKAAVLESIGNIRPMMERPAQGWKLRSRGNGWVDPFGRPTEPKEGDTLELPEPYIPDFYANQRHAQRELEHKRQWEIDTARLAARAAEEERQRMQATKPPPATEPVSRPTLSFEQARMLQRVAIDADEQFRLDLAAGAPHKSQEVYIDEAARRYLASNAQPAPADPPLNATPPKKKIALINDLRPRWPTIDADLSDASRNGLNVARTGKHGMWDESKAIEWAKSKGKLVDRSNVQSIATVWPGGTTRHTLEG